MLTTDPNHPDLGHGSDNQPGQQNKVYLVLSEEERRKGFVRPVRDSYIHVGQRQKFPLRDLTDEEATSHADYGYVKFEVYPEGYKGSCTGRFWTQADLDNKGCGSSTKMGRDLAETYARKPDFYGATYCVGCRMHRPVAEFVWEGTEQTVGS